MGHHHYCKNWYINVFMWLMRFMVIIYSRCSFKNVLIQTYQKKYVFIQSLYLSNDHCTTCFLLTGFQCTLSKSHTLCGLMIRRLLLFDESYWCLHDDPHEAAACQHFVTNILLHFQVSDVHCNGLLNHYLWTCLRQECHAIVVSFVKFNAWEMYMMLLCIRISFKKFRT